jgi:hypothetical protein
MPTKPKTHYKRKADPYMIYRKGAGWQHLYCRGWVYKPDTTIDPEKVTCKRCRGMLAAEMFKFNPKDE